MSSNVDLSGYTPVVEALKRLIRGDLQKIALSDDFVRQSQVYATRQMDRALKAGGDIQEGETRIIRGQVWRGWSLRTVEKYGSVTVDGTRYYMRKFRRGLSFQGPKSKKFYGNQKQTHKGTMSKQDRGEWESQPIAGRNYEKIWKVRASGKRYSESSKMMQDTGALRASLLNMVVRVNGTAIEFRPGTDVSYFDKQNAMRPIFVWDHPVDEPKLAELLSNLIIRKVKEQGF